MFAGKVAISYFQTLEYWIVKCPFEVTSYVQKILETSLYCVAYDPNYNDVDDDQNGMDLDDDQEMSEDSGEEEV